MKTTERTTTATTETGLVMNLTVTAERGYEDVTEKVWIDEYVEVTAKKEINKTIATIEVKGQKITGEFRLLMPDEIAHYGNNLYASFAGKIGVTKVIYDHFSGIIKEAKKEAETDENWIALQAKKVQALKEEMEYDAHVNAVENMMTLKGKTY